MPNDTTSQGARMTVKEGVLLALTVMFLGLAVFLVFRMAAS